MINLYVKDVDGIWLGVACDNEKLFATMFAFSEKRALQGLLESVPSTCHFSS